MHRPIDIQTDDTGMLDLLRKLETLVSGAGGFLHPGLRIIVADGQTRVESMAPIDDLLVSLPESCLVPIDDVQFALRGDDIAVASVPPGYGETRSAMLECMVAIYNRGHKIRQHRAELPWLVFADQPDLLTQLHAARLDAPKPTSYYELAINGDLDALTLDSFMGTRTLQFALDDQVSRRVIMPFVDFFNHHSISPSFQRQDGGLAVACSRPDPGSNECFVRYNAMDAMDTYLNYGFVDRSAYFLRSVPARIDLPGIGTIGIRGRVAQPRKRPLPEGLKDLGIYMPRLERVSDKALVAAQMLIPTSDLHHRLGGAFSVMIRQLAPDGISHDELLTALERATDRLLRANDSYYFDLQLLVDSLAGRLTASAAREQLYALIVFQRKMLAGQRNALSINPDALSGIIG